MAPEYSASFDELEIIADNSFKTDMLNIFDQTSNVVPKGREDTIKECFNVHNTKNIEPSL
ncbi:hypothetical protein FRZ06_11360 [Anoxybacterium hadale]|uniref:Uncharacterized protein n=1 Tax=Anoxybacterium hadale TaxID=3408580 RepID=A0ACD1AC97_9FIRM|nr:hypothetical protein FRZ06_11360 [Clostridiales bacterium]